MCLRQPSFERSVAADLFGGAITPLVDAVNDAACSFVFVMNTAKLPAFARLGMTRGRWPLPSSETPEYFPTLQ
jgi:hypothetical protein